MADTVLYHVVQGSGFLGTVDQNQDFSGIHYGTDTNRQGLLGDFVDVIIEEAAICLDGVGGEGFHTGPRRKAAAWFVEGDMAVGTYTAHKQIDATCLGYHLFIMCALGFQVGGVAVEDVDVLFLDVDVVEEVVPHKAVVAFGVFNGESYVLVHVEGHYVLERENAFLVQLDEVLVKSKGGTTSGTSEDKGMVRRGFEIKNALGNEIGCPNGHLFVIFGNDDFHEYNRFKGLKV